MADTSARNSGNRRQPSRLQRRAPASIKISPVSDWNVAIPLLSPLISSPSSSPESRDLTALIKSSSTTNNKEESRNHQRSSQVVTDSEKPVVFKKWQHPAAPFCCEPAPLVPFVCTGGVDRS